MKRLLLTMLALPMIAGAAENAPAPAAVRNPFWPIGYEGRREVITSEIRVDKPKAPVKVAKPKEEAGTLSAVAKAEKEAAERTAAERLAAEAAKLRVITDEHWAAARKALRIGGRVKARTDNGFERMCAMINGNAYGDGDLVSFNHGNRRFTWRVSVFSDVKNLKLERVKARNLVDPAKVLLDAAKAANGAPGSASGKSAKGVK